MGKATIAINTKLPRQDAYGAIAMPVYHTAAYEFETAKDMADAFCGRVLAPDYSRVMNPTVMHLEDTVKALTGASNVFAFCSGSHHQRAAGLCGAGEEHRHFAPSLWQHSGANEPHVHTFWCGDPTD